jgi:RHS repeat-associated protein
MKLLPPFFSFLAALLLLGVHSVASAESSEPPPAEALSGPAIAPVGSEIPKEHLPENFTDADVFRLRAFSEPLVADRRVAFEEERAAFLKAINDYLSDKGSERLEEFLRDWPESRWTAALEHNLGLLKYREGFFTAAMSYWQNAWERAKDSEDPRLRALANQALAELAGMQARLGRIEVLRPLLGILKEREVGGSARQMLGTSADALHEMENRPEKCFKCGPFALAEVRKSLGIANAFSPEILEIESPYRGFSLSEAAELATKLGMPNTMAKWSDGAEIPVPALVNWKLGHYAAIVGQEGGKYRLKDPTFGFDNLVSAEAIRAEASGYFLLPAATLPPGFEAVPASEGWKVFGRGYTSREMPNQLTKGDHQVPENRCPERGMAAYSVHTMMVSLHVEDTPLGYDPPFGPPVELTVSYNERETLQPANLNYTNFGRQWTHNWNGCIRISSATTATVVLRGGGSEEHSLRPWDPHFSYIHPKSQAKLVRVSETRWERLLPDGSKEVYSALGSAETFWLSEVVDAAGNAATLQYDADYRLSTITDALGQKTSFHYSEPGDIYKVSQVIDPFGRVATFSYNSSGQLVAITDVIGLQSHFSYESGDILSALTTPYGTTSFARAQPSGTERWLEVTDPLGGKERVESKVSAPGITFSDPPAVVPAGSVTVGSEAVSFWTYNFFLDARNTFYWDKKRMLEAPADYTKAKIFHFAHTSDLSQKSAVLECVKEPLENRVWFNHPGQTPGTSSATEGNMHAPDKVARVLEDGSTQLWQCERNALGKVTRAVDPLGRETLFEFAENGIDLLTIRQKNGSSYDTIASFTWNAQHRPLSSTDAAGKTTSYTWNARGQLRTTTNPLNETTSFAYNAQGYLVTIDPPLAGTSDRIRFTYDEKGRVASRAQWGYRLSYSYDDLNRLTRTTFPDGTYEEITYEKLDMVSFRDRLGRISQFSWDANRQLISETDPLTRKILYEWCTCGQLVKLTGPKGNVTQWHHDLQGRVTQKEFADGTKILSSYGTARGLLSSVTDPKGQIKSFAYGKDDSLLGVSYSNADVATPPVTRQWDAAYPRISIMQDGIGQTLYSYVAVGQPGAGRLASVNGPFDSDTITFSYDDLGRVSARSVNGGANTLSNTFDALGRVSSMTTGLGQFTYAYNATRGLLQTVNLPNGETANYTYYGVSNDLRLNTLQRKLGDTEIFFERYTYADNGNLLTRLKRSLGVPGQTLSYSYDDADQLLGVSNPKDPSNYPQSYAYDPAGNLTAATTPSGSRNFTHNSLNERITDAGVAQRFDANGNLSAGMGFTFTWDAEDRLKAISYNGTQKRIEYDYDGQGRRVRIRSLEGAVKTAEYLYIWDGLRLCEKRASAVATFPVAIYDPQGEQKFLSGSYLNYFYLRDRLGSVRGATSNTGSIIQNLDYLPYGPHAQEPPIATDPDFGFTGHLRCPFTGLTLAPYRVLGYANWLSRDPIGEAGGANLYSYVANNPINYVDPTGEIAFVPALFAAWAVAEVALAAWDAYDTASTVADPCKSLGQKVLAGGLFLAGAVLPGGGYSQLDDVAVAAAKTPAFTFRGDARAPGTIFSEGFSARGSSTDLFAHALNNTRPPSAFIPTSKSSDVAAGFADNIYVVRPRGGIDVNQVLGPRSPFPDELEIAVPWRINPSDIRGVTLPSQGMSLLNPNWVP